MTSSRELPRVGAAVTPGDDGYDDARRIYNSVHDLHPALLVRAREAADVVEALQYARAADLEVAVRCGGHSLAGHGSTDGGLLIDLGGIDHIDIDSRSRTARVGGGVRAGALTEATCQHGLVVPFGDSPDVGVGGITLGGGVGWLSRKLGLTVDSLEAAEVVTADGQILTASEHDHPDLFWALRGGGGNFGVVTEFRYRLHPLGAVVGGVLGLPASTGVLRAVLDVAAAAPDELGIIALVTRLPTFAFVPPEAHGRPTVLLTLVWCGDLHEGRHQIDRLRALAPPLVDLVHERQYPEMYSLIAEARASVTNITSSVLADELDDDVLSGIVDSISDSPGPPDVLRAVELRVLGGAIARVPHDATAFGHRHRKYICSVVAAGFDRSDAEQHRAWVDSTADCLRPFVAGAYLNFLDAADQDRLDDVYPDDVRHRLASVKARYDPENVFHRNLNIPPATH